MSSGEIIWDHLSIGEESAEKVWDRSLLWTHGLKSKRNKQDFQWTVWRSESTQRLCWNTCVTLFDSWEQNTIFCIISAVSLLSSAVVLLAPNCFKWFVSKLTSDLCSTNSWPVQRAGVSDLWPAAVCLSVSVLLSVTDGAGVVAADSQWFVFSEWGWSLNCSEHQVSSTCAAVTPLCPLRSAGMKPECWQSSMFPLIHLHHHSQGMLGNWGHTDGELKCLLCVHLRVLTGDTLAPEHQARCLKPDRDSSHPEGGFSCTTMNISV